LTFDLVFFSPSPLFCDAVEECGSVFEISLRSPEIAQLNQRDAHSSPHAL